MSLHVGPFIPPGKRFCRGCEKGLPLTYEPDACSSCLLREENDRLRDLVRRLADYISRLYLDPDAEKRGAALLAEADKELNR